MYKVSKQATFPKPKLDKHCLRMSNTAPFLPGGNKIRTTEPCRRRKMDPKVEKKNKKKKKKQQSVLTGHGQSHLRTMKIRKCI